MIKIVYRAIVKEECIEEFHKTAADLIKASQAEEGNVFYTLNQEIKNKQLHSFIECWKDQAAIDFHNNTEHFTSILPKLQAMCEKELSLELYKEV